VDVRTRSGIVSQTSGVIPDAQGLLWLEESALALNDTNFIRAKGESDQAEPYSAPGTLSPQVNVNRGERGQDKSLAASGSTEGLCIGTTFFWAVGHQSLGAKTMTTKILLLLMICSLLLLTGCSEQAPDSTREIVAEISDMFTIDIDSSKPADQVLELDGRYRIEIRDENGDKLPDHWELYIDGVLRYKRWSPLGYGKPPTGKIYDTDGNVVGHIVTKY